MKTPLTPLDLVRRGLKTYPQRTAVLQPGGPSFTYREWGERIYRLARAVAAAVPAGARVAAVAGLVAGSPTDPASGGSPEEDPSSHRRP